MDSARWEQIQTLFHDALEHPESERQAYLEAACGNDTELMVEVLTMLKADRRRTSVLDRGLPEVAYQVVGASLDAVRLQQFGPYRLRKVLGEGGMGVVWLAEREDAGNLVAIKFLPHAGLSPARRERFAREIKTLAKLKHPFIARLYDAGTLADGTPWFVMEYVEGVRFTDYCRREERPVEERLRLFRAVCEAVEYAHTQEIIHRDLKPSNILVEQDGTPRLLDFGIARQLQGPDGPAEQTRPDLRFLSPDYAAPEWARDGVVGFCTDVYSLGVILYEMLTGRLPIDQTKRAEQAAESGSVELHPDRPSVAAHHFAEAGSGSTGVAPLGKAAWSDLDVLCLKAMHQDPEARYPSVEALVRDIDHYLKGEPLEARPDTLRYRVGKFVKRNRRSVLAASFAVVLMVGLVVSFTVRLAKARNAALEQAARAQRVQQFMLSMFGGDRNAAPADSLRVVTILDRGVQEAQILNQEPAVQSELFETLGSIYQSLQDFERAGSLLQSGLEKARAAFGPDSAEVADSIVALSLLRVDEAKFEEAERLAREAVAIDRRIRPSDPAALGKAMSALGSVLYHRGKMDDAVRVLEEAVRLQSTPPAEPADLVESLTFLSNAQHLLGHDTIAASLGQRVLIADRRIYGDGHPSVAEDLGNLGQIQEGLGQYEEAERSEREAVEITRAWYGKDHVETALEAVALAKTLVYEGKYAEAANLLNPARATFESSLGKAHPFVALDLSWSGVVALKQGRPDEAEADFRRMAEIYRSAYGEKDVHTAAALSRFGELSLARGQYPRAEQFFQQSVQRFSETLSPDNLKTGIARVELGSVLIHELRYQDAETQLLAGYQIIISQGHSSSQEAMDARRNLVALYEALHQPERAAKFRAELAAGEPKKAEIVAGK